MQKPRTPADMRPGRAGQQLMLRLPEALRDRIVAAADRNGRSINAEIVSTLVEHYPEPADPFEAIVQDVLEALSQGDALGAASNEKLEQPMEGPDPLSDLLDRVKQEVARRRS